MRVVIKEHPSAAIDRELNGDLGLLHTSVAQALANLLEARLQVFHESLPVLAEMVAVCRVTPGCGIKAWWRRDEYFRFGHLNRSLRDRSVDEAGVRALGAGGVLVASRVDGHTHQTMVVCLDCRDIPIRIHLAPHSDASLTPDDPDSIRTWTAPISDLSDSGSRTMWRIHNYLLFGLVANLAECSVEAVMREVSRTGMDLLVQQPTTATPEQVRHVAAMVNYASIEFDHSAELAATLAKVADEPERVGELEPLYCRPAGDSFLSNVIGYIGFTDMVEAVQG